MATKRVMNAYMAKTYHVHYSVSKWHYSNGSLVRKEVNDYFIYTQTSEPAEIMADLYEKHRCPELVGLAITEIEEHYDEFPASRYTLSLN